MIKEICNFIGENDQVTISAIMLHAKKEFPELTNENIISFINDLIALKLIRINSDCKIEVIHE